MVTDSNGGVILIGGESLTNKYLDTLWYLQHSQASWTKLPQRLSIGRHYHTAFLVPDEVAEFCNNE